MVEEMTTLEKNKTWEFTTLSEGNRTVGCKWVFTLKYNSDGIINRYKARLVAKGFTQSYGVDYFETFSPVAKLTSIKVILSFSSKFDWPLCQLGIKKCIPPWGFLGRNLYESSTWLCYQGTRQMFVSLKSLYMD